MSSKSPTRHVFLSKTMEQLKEEKKNLHMIFIDLEKAYKWYSILLYIAVEIEHSFLPSSTDGSPLFSSPKKKVFNSQGMTARVVKKRGIELTPPYFCKRKGCTKFAFSSTTRLEIVPGPIMKTGRMSRPLNEVIGMPLAGPPI